MIWLLIALIAAVSLFLFLRKKPAEETAQPVPRFETSEIRAPGDDETFAVITAAIAEFEDSEMIEGELLAILAAAVAEFEGGGEFQVVRIRPGGRNWAFTGRQELMQSRQ
jgi:hypothetical protein